MHSICGSPGTSVHIYMCISYVWHIYVCVYCIYVYVYICVYTLPASRTQLISCQYNYGERLVCFADSLESSVALERQVRSVWFAWYMCIYVCNTGIFVCGCVTIVCVHAHTHTYTDNNKTGNVIGHPL